MGYMRHHAILVSGELGDYLDRVHKAASALGLCLSPIVLSPVNGVQSFCVFPDGSKEGWAESITGDGLRDDLISYIRSLYFEDGSSPLDWAEVQYGDDEKETMVCRSSDADYAASQHSSVASVGDRQ
jgi:hypothetical protein